MSKEKFNSKVFLILAFFFLSIVFIGIISAVDTCSVEARQDCVDSNIPGAKIVMGISSLTNAHGELVNQRNYGYVLCCNFGTGSTTCGANNKLLGLSSATNAHAEVPDLVSPVYNTYNVCYDSLQNCRSVNDGSNPAVGEIQLDSTLSADTNAHLGKAAYTTRIFCAVNKPAICTLKSASWSSTQVLNGTSVSMVVDGTPECGSGNRQVSFEVKRGNQACSSISGCIPPTNVTFAAGSTQVNGTWTAGPASDTNYSFVATVVGTTEQIASPANLRVLAQCPYDPAPVLCSGYTNENDCNNNICNSVVFDPNDTNPRCSWLDNSCNYVSDPPTSEVSIVLNPQNPVIDIGLVKTFTVNVYSNGNLISSGIEPTSCTSSNSTVANLTVGSVCSFKGISAGTATITATYETGGGTIVQNTTTLRVNSGSPVESDIKLLPADGRILVNATQNYSAILTLSNGTEVDVTSQTTFTSSNTTVATINGNVATGASEGITTINGTRTSGTVHEASPARLAVYKDSSSIPQLESIEINSSKGTIKIGKTFTFQVYAKYTDSNQNKFVTFDVGNTPNVSDCVSSNPSIASREGITGCKFKGNAVGTVTITAVYTEAGITKRGTATLNVVSEGNIPSHIEVIPTDRRISVGGIVSYTSWLYWSDPDASPVNVTSQTTFTSSNTTVATINGNVATGKSKGSTEIRGVYNNTYNGLALLHVGPIQPPLQSGICIWDQIVNGSCSNGDEFITVRTVPRAGSASSCVEKPSQRIVCPAQIPLPFFNLYNLIAAISIIAIIYSVIAIREKKSRKG